MNNLTEDEVRDRARGVIGLTARSGVNANVGQLTTFQQLGFPGVIDKPDGWWLPEDHSEVAAVFEFKASRIALGPKQVDELLKNVRIVRQQYGRVVGVLSNGEDTRVFKNEEEFTGQGSDTLQNIEWYLGLFGGQVVDKERIYTLTKRINNCLHYDVGITSLYHRMIFTACALVAESNLLRKNGEDENGYARGGVWPAHTLPYKAFMSLVSTTLKNYFANDPFRNEKASILTEIYDNEIHPTKLADTDPLPETFARSVCEIARFVDASDWNGEDVMGIFFNEFNRYKGKSEAGQILTPEHITDFMYRILDVNKDDKVLDATCGTGGFLTKAMANMIREAGGPNTAKAKDIKSKQLFGIENDRNMFALACANMLLHKDGKSNIEMLDSADYKYRKAKKGVVGPASAWIAELGITKVMMNPPYENKYHCMEIVTNVLDSLPKGCMCGFILPDKKLEKASKTLMRHILRHNRLEKIIKLPEDLFRENIATSIFVFEAGVPQNDREIFACWMKSDGLRTVKNMGRHDVRRKWPAIEDHWVEVMRRMSGDDTCQWVNPAEHLSYQVPQRPFEIGMEDFTRSAMNFLIYSRGLNAKEFEEAITDATLYSSDVSEEGKDIVVRIPRGADDDGRD